jgi:hypothetical protein
MVGSWGVAGCLPHRQKKVMAEKKSWLWWHGWLELLLLNVDQAKISRSPFAETK